MKAWRRDRWLPRCVCVKHPNRRRSSPGSTLGDQPQGAERCDGRDIEDDPHGRPPSQTCGAGFAAELVGCEGARIGALPGCCRKSFDCDFPASLAAALQTFAIANGSNGFVARDRYRARWVFPPSEAAVLLANRGSPHAGYEPLDTAVQHRTASFRDRRVVFSQLVIIHGLNLGVAEFGERRRPSRCQTSATKLVYRTAVEFGTKGLPVFQIVRCILAGER